MGYRIVLVRNGEYKKTLHKSRTITSSITNFTKFIEENTKIIFPQKFINSNRILEVEYRIYMVKDIEKGDVQRLVRDRFGKLYTEKPLFGKWTILDDYEFNFEESFYVYGYDPVHDRKDLRFIMGLLMKNIGDQMMTKSIVVLHNKLIIYNENQFDMVLCKCHTDCVRLYNVLMTTALSKNFKRLIFMGEAKKIFTHELYEMIMDETDWDYRKVTRTTTGPTTR